ncbi:MAG TPA: small ribosomal subunit Rsm22 family protein [Planctomycetota bacterium]
MKELLALYHRDRGGNIGETCEGVRELSDMFNGVTPRRPGYLASTKLRRAYVHYYLPVNAEKVARVLAERDRYAPPGRPLRVLDFGCGPGTAAVAWLLGKRPTASLTLVDVVDEALDDARWFCGQLGATPAWGHEIPEGETYDLILAANVYAETDPGLERHLAPDGHLVVIEPALKQTTRALMAWRDQRVREGWKIAAPCLGQTTCPMLSRSDIWCHMDVPWPRPAGVAEVDRRLGLDKESLKYAYMVLTKTGPTLAGSWRLVSNLHKEKGKAWGWCCGKEGPLCKVEVLTRHRGEATQDFFRADRGDVLDMEAGSESFRSQGPIRRTRNQDQG